MTGFQVGHVGFVGDGFGFLKFIWIRSFFLVVLVLLLFIICIFFEVFIVFVVVLVVLVWLVSPPFCFI